MSEFSTYNVIDFTNEVRNENGGSRQIKTKNVLRCSDHRISHLFFFMTQSLQNHITTTHLLVHVSQFKSLFEGDKRKNAYILNNSIKVSQKL